MSYVNTLGEKAGVTTNISQRIYKGKSRDRLLKTRALTLITFNMTMIAIILFKVLNILSKDNILNSASFVKTLDIKMTAYLKNEKSTCGLE